MSRRRSLGLVGLVAVAVAAPAAQAQQLSVRAYVTPSTTVAVGRPFVLNVELTGTQSLTREPDLPDLSAFAQFLGRSTQSSVRMINGRSSVSLTIQFRYQALSEGSHTIPSFRVEAAGQLFDTDPVEITISAGAAGPTPSEEAGIGADDLFITAEPSKRRVYEGEPLLVEYRIWTRVDVTNFGMTRVPEPEGFWEEDLTPGGQPEVEQRTRNGVQYASAVIRRIGLIPTGPGTRTIEPIGVEAQVRVRESRDPFTDFFGRRSLFGSSTVQTTVLAEPVTIEVDPLPAGRPEPFSGVVGSLDVSASLDRDSVEANEAVTLTVRLTGEGNIRAIPAPDLDLPPDFEAFPPEISERITPSADGLRGTKTFAWVLIPRAPGNREVPAVPFAYFDDDAEAYRVVASDPIPLSVSGTVVEGPAGLARGGVAQLREDIRFIRLGPLELRRTGGELFGGVGFWLFALLPLAAVGGAVALRRHQDRLEGDLAYARGRRAGRLARRRLAAARAQIDVEDSKGFYAEVATALRGLVADRLNLAEAGLQTWQVGEALSDAGVEAELRADVIACLEQCDRERFAPTHAGRDERRRLLERVADLMTTLDRAVR